MKTISIQGITYKQFKDTKYYCSKDGKIYSDFSQKILKPLIKNIGNKQYYYIDINFGNGQKHYPIHKIVYETWIGQIDNNLFVLHKDDNSLNNNIDNLYLGTQQQNIKDCQNNNHRIGNTWILTVYDKEKKETVTFCPAKEFITYSEHSCKNGGIKRVFTRNWFKQRYDIIDYYLCKSLDIKKGVTTMGDECSPVE
jgi:hypothetical protein